MTRKNLVGAALSVLTSGVVLASCGSTTSPATAPSAPSASTAQQGDHNQADIAFAQDMIPHHGQALDMAKLVPGRTSNAKVVDLAGRVQKAQDPEIQQMTGWLKSWGASTGMNMPGMSDSSMPGMSGMMSDADMNKLRAAKGAEFDRMWLEMMVQHHQGAIDMAKTELAQGGNAEVKKLAQRIV